MQRTIVPEILDTLPPDSPEARQSRRDLVLINRLMGNNVWIRRQLKKHLKPRDRLIELGAGSGELSRLAPVLDPTAAAIAGIDLAPRPAQWPPHWTWLQQDILTFEGFNDYDVLVANLILHHFSDTELRALGSRLEAGPRVLIACEPARRRLHWIQAKALSALGISHVTRHDAPVSVRAGFLGTDLQLLLSLKPDAWRINISTTILGAYRMVAVRCET